MIYLGLSLLRKGDTESVLQRFYSLFLLLFFFFLVFCEVGAPVRRLGYGLGLIAL